MLNGASPLPLLPAVGDWYCCGNTTLCCWIYPHWVQEPAALDRLSNASIVAKNRQHVQTAQLSYCHSLKRAPCRPICPYAIHRHALTAGACFL
jgi:hypothetical protein